MQIVEVKNNLVKISYDTSAQTLILSGFVVIKDALQSFIGQVIHLEANSKGNSAIVKLLFTFDDSGVISNYNGSIPDINSILDIVQPQELLELLPLQNPIVLGELAQQNTQLKLDRTFLEQNLLICSEKSENNEILTKNLVSQLAFGGKKVLVFDVEGNVELSENKIVAGKDFKLPLNYETINFIYERGLDDAKAETKAMIQEIFLEVQDYVKTLDEKFIPFETFKTVVNEQYEETELVELVLLKNKLLKYNEAGIFAQEQSEFDSLKAALNKNGATVFDLSNIDEKIQREMISYAYAQIAESGEEVYVFCNVDNSNSDKKLLKQIFSTKNAYSTLICSYAFKYLKELKQLSKDLILFAPIQTQNDFAGYNTFLGKLNNDEFVVYGNATHNLPLIVKLEELPEEVFVTEETLSESAVEDSAVDEQIKRDLDAIYTVPKSELAVEEDPFVAPFVEENSEEDLTEDDLDLIDDLNIVETVVNEEIIDEIVEEFPEVESFDESIEQSENEDVFESDAQMNEAIEELIEEEIQEEIEEELIQETFEENFGPSGAKHEEVFVMEEPKVEPEDAAPQVDILPVKMASTPIVPIYSADIEPKNEAQEFVQGDIVSHAKYGKGTVEKLISYGSKTLCSINFDNVGRRLLDPSLAEIKKI